MAVAPRIPREVPKSVGGWSVTNLKAWMVIKWPGLLGLNTSIQVPAAVTSLLRALFPPSILEGVPIELIQVSTDYGVNEIPTANAQVAVGRLAINNRVIAAIHYLVKNLKLFVGASLYCQGSVTSSQGIADQWPVNPDGTPKPFRIFDGFITGTGFRKTPQGIEFNISMTNWLSDLNFSSTLSRSSSPQNPGQISFDPGLPTMPSAGARLPTLFREGASLTQAMPIISSAVLSTDLWGAVSALPDTTRPDIAAAAIGVGGLKQWFTEVCRTDRINWRQIGYGSCDGTVPDVRSAKNVEALAALMRFEPLSVSGRLRYIDGVPLAMDSRPGVERIAQQIATHIGFDTFNIHNYTIWDKLIQFAAQYQFAIVPMVEKALIVPFNPGLRRSWATVFANDYDYYERSDFIPRPLRGIGLFVNRGFFAGGSVSLNNSPIINTVGAYYENPNRRNGLVVWKESPQWLSTVILPHMYSPARSGVAVPTAFDASGGPVPDRLPPHCLLRHAQPLWCDYARGLYIQEILRGRNGRLSGRLRFDIAPGSIIRIEEPEEEFILRQMGTDRSYVYCMAVRVSCVLNAEASKAGTAIQFAFARDSDENQDPSYSTDRHPLWANNWYGSPLVVDPVFYPGGLPGVSPPENKSIPIRSASPCGTDGGTLPRTTLVGDGPAPPIPPDGLG